MAKKSDLTAPPEISAPPEIEELVEKFAEHRETYRRPGYNETQLRQDFLDSFFIALGWDIYNRDGIHENYRDVILEHALRVEKSVKAPDYCIRIGPVPKFFVEANCAVNASERSVLLASKLSLLTTKCCKDR